MRCFSSTSLPFFFKKSLHDPPFQADGSITTSTPLVVVTVQLLICSCHHTITTAPSYLAKIITHFFPIVVRLSFPPSLATTRKTTPHIQLRKSRFLSLNTHQHQITPLPCQTTAYNDPSPPQ